MKTKKNFRIKTSTRNLLAATALIFLALISAKAQSIKGGITLGVTSSDVKINRSFNNVMSGKNIYGFEGGFFLRPKLGPFFVKPELLYEYRTGNVETQMSQTNNMENPTVSTKFNMHNLEVPVLFGICICPLFIEGGPVYNYILEVTKVYNNNEVNLNRNGLGYRVGGGLDFGALILHAHYQGLTYKANSEQAILKDPSKLIFGLSLKLGGRHHHENAYRERENTSD